jgi:hypothetical protein
MVAKRIRSFERGHPDIVIQDSAKTLLLKHAKAHEKSIKVGFKERTQTQTSFLKGLDQILSTAASSKQPATAQFRVYKMSARTVAEKRGDLPPPPVRSTLVISSAGLRSAMKKKCKTFPWC